MATEKEVSLLPQNKVKQEETLSSGLIAFAISAWKIGFFQTLVERGEQILGEGRLNLPKKIVWSYFGIILVIATIFVLFG